MSSRILEGCTNCDACAPLCPTQSISKGSRTYVVDSDTCTDCLLCVPACPVSAIVNDKKVVKAGKPPRKR